MKLYEFLYNYVGHHLEWFLVDSNQFVKECLAIIFRFSKGIPFFLAQIVIISDS